MVANEVHNDYTDNMAESKADWSQERSMANRPWLLGESAIRDKSSRPRDLSYLKSE